MISPLLTWRTRYTDAFDRLNLWLWANDYAREKMWIQPHLAEAAKVRAKRDYLEHLFGLDAEREYERPDDSHYRMEREMFE